MSDISDQRARLSAYGHIKRAQILGSLSPAEQGEVEQLEARQRLSAGSQARLDALWAKAFARHVPPQLDPSVAYAAEVGGRMRAS
jgi:hypothetical protein